MEWVFMKEIHHDSDRKVCEFQRITWTSLNKKKVPDSIEKLVIEEISEQT